MTTFEGADLDIARLRHVRPASLRPRNRDRADPGLRGVHRRLVRARRHRLGGHPRVPVLADNHDGPRQHALDLDRQHGDRDRAGRALRCRARLAQSGAPQRGHFLRMALPWHAGDPAASHPVQPGPGVPAAAYSRLVLDPHRGRDHPDVRRPGRPWAKRGRLHIGRSFAAGCWRWTTANTRRRSRSACRIFWLCAGSSCRRRCGSSSRRWATNSSAC